MTRKSNKISTRGFVKPAMILEPFWMKPIFLILNASENVALFKYPEWLIMFIAILSVKLKIKTYIQIHKMAVSIGTSLPKEWI